MLKRVYGPMGIGVNTRRLGEIPKRGASLLLFLTKFYEDNQIKEDR
jgi:hypothetical protein